MSYNDKAKLPAKIQTEYFTAINTIENDLLKVTVKFHEGGSLILQNLKMLKVVSIRSSFFICLKFEYQIMIGKTRISFLHKHNGQSEFIINNNNLSKGTVILTEVDIADIMNAENRNSKFQKYI